jgi:hypothetical protein
MVHLLVVSTPLLTVKIANGDTIPCCGKVTAVTLKSQGHPIIADFYLISLGGGVTLFWASSGCKLLGQYSGISL